MCAASEGSCTIVFEESVRDYGSAEEGPLVGKLPMMSVTLTTPPDRDERQSHAAIIAIERAIRENGGSWEREERHFPPYGKSGHDLGATLTQLVGTLPDAAALIAFFRYASPVIVQWLKNRGSRRVEASIRGTKIAITGAVDIDKAIASVEHLHEVAASAAENPGNRSASSSPGRRKSKSRGSKKKARSAVKKRGRRPSGGARRKNARSNARKRKV